MEIEFFFYSQTENVIAKKVHSEYSQISLKKKPQNAKSIYISTWIQISLTKEREKSKTKQIFLYKSKILSVIKMIQMPSRSKHLLTNIRTCLPKKIKKNKKTRAPRIPISYLLQINFEINKFSKPNVFSFFFLLENFWHCRFTVRWY